MADKAGLSIVGLEDSPEIFANMDAALMAQVVTNLVVNSIQAMPGRGGIRVTVSQELATPPADVGSSLGTYACLRVEDQGVGIPPQHFDHIFEPFFTTKDVNQGTGLGLSVAYGIVREHGGWIKVASEVDKGSCFSVYLPLAQEGPNGEQNVAGG